MPRNLNELLVAQAACYSEKDVFRFLRDHPEGDACLTFAGLFASARSVSNRVRHVVDRRSRVLLAYPPGLDFIEAFFGCCLADVVPVPVAPPNQNRRNRSLLESVMADCRPVAVLSTSAGIHRWREEQSLTSENLRLLATDETDPASDGGENQGMAPIDQRLDDALSVDPDSVAFIQYTSGSTSTPRGVEISHRNLLCNSALIQASFGNTSDSRGVFWLPLFHDMGLIGGVIQTLFCGGTSVLMAPAVFLQRPLTWLRTISETRATVSGGPDFAYDFCARKIDPAECSGLDLSSWGLAFTGAEPIRSDTLDRFAERFEPFGFRREALYPCYGLAEATLMVSGGPKTKTPKMLHVDAKALSKNLVVSTSQPSTCSKTLVGCGSPPPGHHIQIVDPATGNVCQPGQVGEIWVAGDSVALGYFNRPQASEQIFRARLRDCAEAGLPGTSSQTTGFPRTGLPRTGLPRTGFLRTGDLGFIESGSLYVTGRKKDLIIVRGRNYYPHDIEASAQGANRSFRIGACAAFSVEPSNSDSSPVGSEQLVVVQELEPRVRELDVDSACESVRRAVAAEHEIDVSTVVLTKAGSIPRTSSGKIRRARCRELFLAGELKSVAVWTKTVSPIDEAEPQSSNSPTPNPSSPGTSSPRIPSAGTEPTRMPSSVPPGSGRHGSESSLPGSGSGASADANRPKRPPTSREIESWLVVRIAGRLGLDRRKVGVFTPFVEFGMSSLDAIEITADLERWIGHQLSPTAVYNYPTIAALAKWLASGESSQQVAEPTQAASENLLSEVLALSEAEMQSFIEDELTKRNG